MTINMTKADVLERLEKNLAVARGEDAKAKKAHEVDEGKHLVRFRAELRDAIKWDYKKAKDKGFYLSMRGSSPSCPVAVAPPIAKAIELVKADAKQKYTIHTAGDLYPLLFWKPESQREKKTLCD